MVGVRVRTSCRQLFKELNILTLVSLYTMEIICYIRKHHQFVDLYSNIHIFTKHQCSVKYNNHLVCYLLTMATLGDMNIKIYIYLKFHVAFKEPESHPLLLSHF